MTCTCVNDGFWQIANSGIDLKIIKSPGGAQTITVTRREGGHTVSETITTRSPGAGGLASGPKRPRIESNYRKQFESQVGPPQSMSCPCGCSSTSWSL